MLVFLNLVDAFTPTHLKVLKFLHDAKDTMPDISQKHIVNILQGKYPEYRNEGQFLGQRIDELADKALIETSEVGSDTRGINRHVKPPYMTNLGERFYRFISVPEELTI